MSNPAHSQFVDKLSRLIIGISEIDNITKYNILLLLKALQESSKSRHHSFVSFFFQKEGVRLLPCSLDHDDGWSPPTDSLRGSSLAQPMLEGTKGPQRPGHYPVS